MTNDPDNDVKDALVSETYRSHAREHAPEHINERVLRMAAQAAVDGATHRPLSSSWMKPVAWAATIALSLAIVLQVAESPDFDPDKRVKPGAPSSTAIPAEAGEPDAPPDSLRQEIDNLKSSVVEEADEMARLRDGRNQPVPVAGPSDKGDRKNSPDKARRADIVAVEMEASAADSDSASLTLETQDMPGYEKKELHESGGCDTKLRDDASKWFACIEQLRASGAVEAADQEYIAFEKKYPDFRAHR